ncbi:hypothetical protein AADZ91_07340 [Colwelliaceae bacterium 6441]
MKQQLVNKIVDHLDNELNALLEAAKNAHIAAIDEQSVAETQYDTLAIEAGYLAEGQSRRVDELKQAMAAFTQLNAQLKQQANPYQLIKCGALIQLSQDKQRQHYFFLAPAAAGFRCEINGQKFTVITPNSPMGKALLDKTVDDECIVDLGDKQHIDDIIFVK